MKSNEEKLKELNHCIKVIKKSLKNHPQDDDARKWGEKQLKRWEVKKEKLELLTKK